MFIKTTLRLAVLASAIAFTAAAPAAFAQMASPDGGQPSATPGSNNEPMMRKKDMSPGVSGYTGTTNATERRHHKRAHHMKMKMKKARNTAVPAVDEKSKTSRD